MSLVLNAYVKKDSAFTADNFAERLASYPNIQPNGDGEFLYENEDTGVYCTIGNDPPEEAVKGYTSLDMSFVINYLRPSFFGLELFNFVEAVVDDDIYIDNEQEGAPAKFDRQKMYSEWLDANDKGYEAIFKQSGRDEPSGYAYQPRNISQKQWKFLYQLNDLQETSGDVYIARLFHFISPLQTVVTAVAWPDCIPIIIPPSADYFIVMENKKKLFKQVTVQHGMIKLETMLRHFGDSFTKQSDGSYSISKQRADAIRQQVMALSPDLKPGTHPGTPISVDKIIDTPVMKGTL